MSVNFKGLSDDVFDDYFGEILAMTVFATIAFAAFLLENNHLVAFEESGFNCFATAVVSFVSCNFANNLCAFNGGGANLYGAVIVDEKNAVELYGLAGLYLIAEIVNIQEAVLFCLELLALNFYDNVHYDNEL